MPRNQRCLPLQPKTCFSTLKVLREAIIDGELLEGYFRQYFEVLHRYAYTIVKDSDEAKDVVQNVFLQLWQRKNDIAIQQSVRSYLYTATHNTSLNSLRSNKTRTGHQQNAAAQSSFTGSLPDETDSREIRREILAALQHLPEKCRLIFYKNRFEEKTYAEIARELNLSVKTVEAQMGKALRILREILSQWALVLLLLGSLINEIGNVPCSI